MIVTAAQILATIGPDEEEPDRTIATRRPTPGRPMIYDSCQAEDCQGEPEGGKIVRGMGPRCYRRWRWYKTGQQLDWWKFALDLCCIFIIAGVVIFWDLNRIDRRRK